MEEEGEKINWNGNEIKNEYIKKNIENYISLFPINKMGEKQWNKLIDDFGYLIVSLPSENQKNDFISLIKSEKSINNFEAKGLVDNVDDDQFNLNDNLNNNIINNNNNNNNNNEKNINNGMENDYQKKENSSKRYHKMVFIIVLNILIFFIKIIIIFIIKI